MPTTAPSTLPLLYRTNSQSRAFEEALRAHGMRYRMLGGFFFLSTRGNQGRSCLRPPGDFPG